MNAVNNSMSSASGSVLFDAVIESFGVCVNWQPGVSSRFCGKRSLLTPISTLYASPENINKDLFCAFQPNRVIVPSSLSAGQAWRKQHFNRHKSFWAFDHQ
jgi:hypothetical protein